MVVKIMVITFSLVIVLTVCLDKTGSERCDHHGGRVWLNDDHGHGVWGEGCHDMGHSVAPGHQSLGGTVLS